MHKSDKPYIIYIIVKGWGFCNEMCEESYKEIHTFKLKQMNTKILSDKLCRKFGSIYRHNKLRQKANTRKELCSGFVNNINVTIAKYTIKRENKKQKVDAK